MGTTLPDPQKGAEPPIFGPCQLWPNGWNDQDATRYEGRPRLKPDCARWGPSSPQKREAAGPQFSAHVCCGQTAGWIKMPLGTKVGLGTGNIVLDADPDPPPRGTDPQFLAHVCCGQTARWMKMPVGTKAGLGQATLCYTGTQLPPKGAATQFSAHVYCGEMVAHLSYCRVLVLFIQFITERQIH